MSDGLIPYPTYKDSGVPWLGKIPADWEIRRLKWLASLNPSKTEAQSILKEDTPVVFLPMERVGVDGIIDTREILDASKVWSGFTYFKKGDVLVAKITPCFENGKGACLDSLPTEFGFGSTEFHVLRAKPYVSQHFLYRLTTLAIFRQLGADSMTGAAGQQRVPNSFIANFLVAVPSVSEQDAIVGYLDHADRQIRRYIRAKRRTIELLHEQKQAIIHQAVTRGLDPNVPLKPSGVEWLGDVPAHWEVLRSKYIFREVDDRSSTGDEPRLSMSQKLGLVRSSLIEERRLMSESNIGAKVCWKDDLVLNRLKAHLGVFALASELGLVSPDYTVLRAQTIVSPQYFEFVLRTPACRVEFRKRVKGIVQGFWRLYTEDFYNILLPVPPVSEQHKIVAQLESNLADLNQAIDRVRNEIDLIREYRTRLIADVVTGKIDVRAAAQHLPSQVDEAELWDEDVSKDEENLEEVEEASPDDDN